MLERALIAVAVLAISTLAWRLWRRSPGALLRLDLGALGIDGPAIVQFSTEYCAPCRAAAPLLEATARLAEVGYAEIDLGGHPELAGRYRIRSVPTVVVATADGRVVGSWVGVPGDGEIARTALRAREAN